VRKAQRLKKEAREAATWRGHDLGRFEPSKFWTRGDRFVATAYCKAPSCEAQVTVNTHPAPNQTDIMGDAVAVGCPTKENTEMEEQRQSEEVGRFLLAADKLEKMDKRIRLLLDPRRFPNMSGVMGALVSYVMGMDPPAAEPTIVELTTTSDGMLLARNEGDCGFNEFIGGASDYKKNWERLITMPEVGLTQDEIDYVRRRYHEAANLKEVEK